MDRNGQPRNLRVLLSGPAADQLEATLDEAGVSMVRPSGEGSGLRVSSPVDVALHVVASSSSPELVSDIRDVRALAKAPLILAAYGAPNGIVEVGLEVGAADVLLLPQSSETLMFALHKASAASGATPDGKIVTVFSPKGGSGKTVLATNIAAATARAGIHTLLVDFDLQFGDTALMLAVSPRATISDMAGSSGDVDIEKLNAFVNSDARNDLALLAAPRRPEEAEIVRQADLEAVLDAARNGYEAIVVDTGPLFDGPMIAALDRSDQLILVCTPEVTSLKNVRIGLETIDRLGFPRDRVLIVANRIGASGGIVMREMEDALGVEIGFELPDDPGVPAAVNRAIPSVLSDEKGRFSKAVSQLATSLFAEPVVPEQSSHRRSLLRGRR
jgi:MinD-like ATPase involved in chromosome partitioning or flagellar assembly